MTFISSSAFSQSQMKKWWIHNNIINTNALSVTSDVRSGTNLTGPTNSLYDKNLQLKFYINNAQIRAANGTLISNLTLGVNTSEYSIVPFIGLDACSDEKYYVFYHYVNSSSYGLRYQVIQVNKTTGLASALGSEVVVFSGNVPINNSYAPHGAIAVGAEVNNKRYLYYLSGRESVGSIQKMDISKSSSTFSGVGIPSSIFNSSNVLYNALELDLSIDGTKLGWGSSHETLNYSRAFVLNLNSSGGYTGIMKNYLLSNYTTSKPGIIKGVEFNDQGNVLFMGLGQSGAAASSTGILAIDIITNIITRIPNSENYSTSQIERGSDGNMYVGNVTGTNSFLNSFSQTTPYFFNTAIAVPLQRRLFTGNYVPNQYLVYLPDQIDGENYEVIQNNLSPIAYDITNNITLSGSNLWDESANPYSKSELFVGGTITIPNGATLNLRNLSLNFNSSSNIVVDGGVLRIDAATLQSINCALMWPGISVFNGGRLYIGSDPSFDQPSYVKDAIIGIDAIGNNRIDVNNARFFANETDIHLNNVAATTNNSGPALNNPNTLIRNSQFNHTTNLKDQNRGIAMISNTLPKKGYIGIQIVNTNNPVIFGPDNSFEAGLYGINAISSNISISGNNTFANIRGSLNPAIPATGIRVVNASASRKNTTIHNNNTFNNCQRGIFARGSLNLIVSNNDFIGSKETALSVTKNKKAGVIDINHNSFDFCNWEAINLFDNGYPIRDENQSFLRTSIEVTYNTIINHPYASGIVIQELAKNVELPFSKFLVKDNTLGQSPNGRIGQGVIVRNVLANAPAYKSTNSSIGSINSNFIYYTTVLNPNYNGITIENSSNLATINNNMIQGDNKVSNSNSGLFLTNSQKCDVSQNQFQNCGNGMKTSSHNENSNYYCNNFTENRNGINLRDGHVLRAKNELHGVCTGPWPQSRENTYTSSLNTDINRASNVDPNRNRWIFNPGALPKIITELTGVGPLFMGSIVGPCRGYNCNSAPLTFLPNPFDPWADNSFPDAYLWNLQFNAVYEAMANNLPYDAESNFANIVKIGNYFAKSEYDSAVNLINNFSPSNMVESDFKDLYSLIADANYPIERTYTESEINYIRSMANLSTYFNGPQVSTARALLNYLTGENTTDMEEVINDITGEVHTACTDSELEGIRLYLIDENQDTIPEIKGYIDPETRRYHFFGEQLSQLDPNLMVSVWANSPDYGIPAHKPLFEWLNSIAGSNAISISCSGEKTKQINVSRYYYSIFPNPTSDFINITTNDTKELSYKIYAITGEQVLTGTNQKNPISLVGLSSGYYFVTLTHIESNEMVHTEKLIILNK